MSAGLQKPQPVPGVIWITGYSASGKTTVARKVESRLRAYGLRTVFLDGDDLRSIFGNKWGYTREERVELAHVYFRLCSHLVSQGSTVVIAAIAMYKEVSKWMHTNIPNAVEVFLNVPEDERRLRDTSTKKVYERMGDINLSYDKPRKSVYLKYKKHTVEIATIITKLIEYNDMNKKPWKDWS